MGEHGIGRRQALFVAVLGTALLTLVLVVDGLRNPALGHRSTYKGHGCDGNVTLTCFRHAHRESTYHVHHYAHMPNHCAPACVDHEEHRTVHGNCVSDPCLDPNVMDPELGDLGSLIEDLGSLIESG